MSRGAGNQQGPPYGGHPATNANPLSIHPYQPTTHYTYPPFTQLNQPNSSVSVSATHLSESIVHRLTPGLNAAFSTLHRNTLTQVNNVQNSIQNLSKNFSDARGEAHKETMQVTNILEASHALQTKAIKRVLDRVDKLENVIGENDGTSLIQRISSIEFVVAELVERMRDPDAPVVSIIRQDAAISPRREILPPKRYRDISAGPTPPQSPALPPVWSPTDEQTKPREGEGKDLAKASEALRSRFRASVDALKASIGVDLFEDIPGSDCSTMQDELGNISAVNPAGVAHQVDSDLDNVSPQNMPVGAAEIALQFSIEPFTADRLAKPAEWSTKGVHPSSLASTSASLSDLQSASPNKPSQQPSFSPSPVPIRPARDIPEGTVASLRQKALGDHLFVRPLEDTGLPKLNTQTIPPLDVSYPPSDAIDISATTTLLSPPATTSPEDISFEFPDATNEEDVPELVLTPETSFASSEQDDNPELEMKQELDFISRKLASSPARREETLSPLSALEDDEHRSVSTDKPAAVVINVPSSSTRREKSFPSMSSDDEQPISKLRHQSLSSMSSEDDQPLSKSRALTANISSSSVPRGGSLSPMSSGGGRPLSKPPVLAANISPPSVLRDEFVSRVSSDAGQPLSKSRALTAHMSLSSVHREESLSAMSPERDQPLSKSPVSVASIPVPINVPARDSRRLKRKRNGNSQTQQQAKKIKTEMENTSVPPAKGTLTRPRNCRSQTVNHSPRKAKFHSRSKSKSTPVLCEWPAKTQGEAKYSYIQCDNCEKWYHYGCVGIVSNDLRLEDDEQFTCPPCHYSPATRVTLRGHEDECARPDCSFPGHAEAEGEFVVERIIGRKPTAGSGTTNFLWLIKWDGYPIKMAEWCPETNMGDCAKLVLKFNEDVVAEGLEIDTDQPILLEEAINGGWDE